MSKIFISHSHLEKKIAGEIKSQVEKFGTSAFVAHEDIRPTREWQDAIIENLKQCDVFLAILTSNFQNSNWTDQETGIALGLGKVIIPIRIDIAPYGFIGKYQALKWDLEDSTDSVKRLIQLLVEKKALNIDNILEAFENSFTFRNAEYNLDLLRGVQQFSKEQINKIVNASVENRQIWDATGTQPILDKLFSEYSDIIDPELLKKWKSLLKGSR